MRKVLMISLLLAGLTNLFAQSDMKPVSDAEIFKKKINTETKKINSLECDFIQLKYMTALSGEIKSTGKFYYQKEDKVNLDYITPMKYRIVINGSKIKMVSNGKENVYDVSSNALMKEMKDVVSACLTGNIDALTGNYKMEFLENSKEYLVKIYPQDAAAKSVIEEIHIYFGKADMSVSRMRMVEASKDKTATQKDYTEYQFSNQKINTPIPVAQFAIK